MKLNPLAYKTVPMTNKAIYVQQQANIYEFYQQDGDENHLA